MRMKLDRARKIWRAICDLSLETVIGELPAGSTAAAESLAVIQVCTLEECIKAVRRVDEYESGRVDANGNRVICVIPADRLIAAAYTLAHHRDREGIGRDNLILRVDVPGGFEFIATGHRSATA